MNGYLNPLTRLTTHTLLFIVQNVTFAKCMVTITAMKSVHTSLISPILKEYPHLIFSLVLLSQRCANTNFHNVKQRKLAKQFFF